jgi:hypothetical protein
MNGWRQTLRQLLGRGGADAGCDDSLEVLDQLVEEEMAGRVVAEVFPDVALHLEACPDCREEYEGLRDLVGASGGEDPTGAP